MIISTRGRYALRVMLDLADHCDGGFIPMKDVAQRQDVSLKYLERIMPARCSAAKSRTRSVAVSQACRDITRSLLSECWQTKTFTQRCPC